MILRYKKADGTQVEFELGERAITIGRSTEADLVILDQRASRVHCGIRLWDGDFYIKDLKSRNGTFVNGQPIEMAKLNPGDQIRVGNCAFSFEAEAGKGNETILREIQEEMSQGKGYATILKEVVEDIQEPPAPAKPAAAPKKSTDTATATPSAGKKKLVIKASAIKPSAAPEAKSEAPAAPATRMNIRFKKSGG